MNQVITTIVTVMKRFQTREVSPKERRRHRQVTWSFIHHHLHHHHHHHQQQQQQHGEDIHWGRSLCTGMFPAPLPFSLPAPSFVPSPHAQRTLSPPSLPVTWLMTPQAPATFSASEYMLCRKMTYRHSRDESTRDLSQTPTYREHGLLHNC